MRLIRFLLRGRPMRVVVIQQLVDVRAPRYLAGMADEPSSDATGQADSAASTPATQPASSDAASGTDPSASTPATQPASSDAASGADPSASTPEPPPASTEIQLAERGGLLVYQVEFTP